ncbi:hypothetical protein vBAcoSR7M_7 [Alteromonas phage vB_AcoS-R7M]|uniref:Uncharacterized protein n=1 Tax=Alteromonas phage vB_AcoS-R7M TaxID=2729541 RepID=A0A6M3YN47_9CAUD|nr:hypothetical protein HWD34_gp07 [Alteromonas phage vB_AcoS-R7M]QJI53329.1 hypothetical protein vBAcoSR7M_7 [Alteromonas phage vB_AcoS-R7M]
MGSKVISTKVELIEWLKEQHIYSDVWSDADIPDVRPARVSKWVDCGYDPDWLADTVYMKVPRGYMREEIGGWFPCMLDLTEQGNTVRVRPVRVSPMRKFYTRVSKLGYLDMPRSLVYSCVSKAALLELINERSNWKIYAEQI